MSVVRGAMDSIAPPPATSHPVSIPISSDAAEPTAKNFRLPAIPPTGLAIQIRFRKAILSDFRRVRHGCDSDLESGETDLL